MSGACDSAGQTLPIPPDTYARYVVSPLHDYCGVEFYEPAFLKSLQKYFHHPTRFILKLDLTQTLGSFLEERKNVLLDQEDYIEDYPCGPVRGKPKKPDKKLNKNKRYELDFIKELEICTLNKEMKIGDLIKGINIGLELWNIRESLRMGQGSIIYPKYHKIFPIQEYIN